MSDLKKKSVLLLFLVVLLTIIGSSLAESPYRFFTWNVTFGDIYPLGVKQQGILINGQFPGPPIEAVTNDNLIISVFNSLDEPFLLSWNGIQQRRNSWQDGVYGTNCPIPPGQNFTYVLQVKDQIGSYYYFPSLAFHKAAGGYGGIRIDSRPLIPVPFPPPAGDFTVLAGDWYKMNHTDLKAILDGGHDLPFPDGLVINGHGSNGNTFTVDQGKTYRFRISNVGIATSINFRIQGHKLILVETEGDHTLQNTYSSLDVHLGQSYSVLVTMDQPPQDYYIVVSTRFTSQVLTTTSTLHYSNSAAGVTGPPPGGPTTEIDWSLNQARSVRQNLTASGPRPNPQGSYHYGMINTTRTIRLANSAPVIDGKQRYAVNGVSFIPADTPLKLADFFKISGVFSLGSISDSPSSNGASQQTSVMAADYRAFVEVVFENSEDIVQSWHIDGHVFFIVGLANSAPVIDGKQRYAVNGVSFIPADTPLKLADFFKISGVFSLGSISDSPSSNGASQQTSVMAADYRAFVEVVFENSEDIVQSWHIDGHVFFIVGMEGGQWSTDSRSSYNLRDGISRCSVQVYPNSWTAVYMPLDNVGMWNIRSENWARQYLGQQFYLRVYSPANSWRDEYPIPSNALLCGQAVGNKKP